MRFRCCPLIATVLAFGCSGIQGPATTYETQERLYRTGWKQVWDAVLVTLTDLDIPIEHIETSSGFVRSDLMSFGTGISYAALFDCGSYHGKAIAGRTDFGPEARLTVLVLELNPARTRVRVRVLVTGTVQREVPVHCVSTGSLEDDFYSHLSGLVESAEAGSEAER